MMNSKIIYFTFLLFSGILYAQTEEQVYNYFKGISKEKGFEKLDSLIDLNENEISFIYLKGMIASNVYNDYEMAIDSYERFLELSKDSLDHSMTYLNLCKNYYKIKQKDKAMLFLKKAEKINPENPYILHELGYMIDDYSSENLEVQYQFYQKALVNTYKFEFDKKDKSLEPMILGNIGFNLYHQKRTTESEIYLLKSIALEENENVFNNLANTYQRMEKFDEALKYYDKALFKNPKYLYSINGKANTLFKQGNDRITACELWQEALNLGYKFQEEWREQYDIENPEILIKKFCNEI